MNSEYPFKHDIIYAPALFNDNQAGTDTDHLVEKAKQKIQDIKQNLHAGGLPLYEVPGKKDDLAEIEKTAGHIRDNFDHVVVLGTGGSSLGARALLALRKNSGKSPKVHILPNLAAGDYEEFLESLPCKNTLTIVISKSGNTTDTLTQTLIMMKHVAEQVGKDALAKYFLFITEPGDSLIRRLADTYGIDILDHIPGLGGRFSVLSNVGLLPAAICGLNIQAIRDGAQAVMDHTLNNPAVRDIPAVMGAAFIISADAVQGKSINIMMPYINRLQKFTDWYVQLWAESLGKQGNGTTPLAALGPRDQHSQLQMFLDGKKDKSMTFITAQKKHPGAKIDTSLFNAPEISHLHDKDMADVIDAFYQGTLQSILDAKIPCRNIELDELNEYSLGALMMHFMLETIFAASMLDINAFDQPKVEDGKKYAKQILSK